MKKVPEDPRDLRLVVVFLRSLRFWDRTKLATESELSRNTIDAGENGDRDFTRRSVARIAAAVGFPSALLDPLVSLFRLLRTLWEQGELWPEMLAAVAREAGGSAEQWTAIVHSAVKLYLAQQGEAALVDGDPEEVRQAAREAYVRLATLPAEQRRLAVARSRKLQTWGMVEVLCCESARAAAHSAPAALELAELALEIAGRLDASIRLQAQGYAWGFVSNARRVAGNLPQSEAGFVLAEALWPADLDQPCPLDRSRLLDLKASLRRDQRRPLEALDLLERAARTPDLTPIARARLQIQKGNALEALGEYESALAALGEAVPAVADGQEPHLLWLVHFGLAVNLCYLDRAAEVSETLLPAVRLLAAQEDNDLSTLRLRWLESKVAAGLGQIEEAIVALSRVREEFVDLELDSDAALATSELAVLYLEIGRTAEVKALVLESIPIFQAKGIYPEEQKALAVFREAVERETVTLALARRLVAYLRRAHYDESVRFEE